jgi:hypothetical protein
MSGKGSVKGSKELAPIGDGWQWSQFFVSRESGDDEVDRGNSSLLK